MTAADLASQAVLAAGLPRLAPGVPLLAEEAAAPPWAERRRWRRLWILDPLDGTRELLAGRETFTINLALVVAGRLRLGLIHHPPSRTTWAAWRAETGWRGWIARRGRIEPLRPRLHQGAYRVVVSAARGLRDLAHLPRALAGCPLRVARLGSALKFAHLAEGRADFYPRRAPCRVWDVAAGMALVAAAGGGIRARDGRLPRLHGPSLDCPPFSAWGARLAFRLGDQNRSSRAPAVSS
ncbi:MAG: hypothetical protein KatS3mg124_0511 [Porticoccaceae bacterium]|nr:MAG: hypothetical protein KatS3mg124_0511 [Porticoccaceae bacterium]